MKYCRICGVEITSDNIYKGQHGICKSCDNLRRSGYYKSHPEQAEKSRLNFRSFYAEHKAKVQERNRKWKESNPERNNYNRRMENRLRKYRVKNAAGKFTVKEWESKVKEYNSCCAYCSQSIIDDEITIDHVMPLSKSGTNNIDNLVPSCLPCNVRKYNSVPVPQSKI